MMQVERPINNFEQRVRRKADTGAHDLFVEAVDAAIRYEHPPPAIADGKARRAVWDRMKQQFHDDFYVERPVDEAEIAACAGAGRVLALSGERGCGKTTLLRRISYRPELVENAGLIEPTQRDIDGIDAAAPTKQFLYIDLVSEGTELRFESTSTDEVEFAVLRFLLEEMIDRTISRSTSPTHAVNWASYQAQNSQSFRRFRRSARRIRRFDGKNWDKELQDPTIALLFDQAEEQFLADENLERSIGEFLEFLAKHYKHSVAIALDSLDHYPPDVQVAVGVSLTKLVRSSNSGSSAVFAVREDSFDRINALLEPMGGLTGIDVVPHEILPASTSLISQFLRTRLELVRDTQEAFAIELSEDAAQDLRIMLERNLDLLELIIKGAFVEGQGSRVLGFLKHWHNGSIRHIGRSVQRMLTDAVTDGNEVTPIEEIDAAIAAASSADEPTSDEQHRLLQLNRTLIRSHLFRKFFFSGPKTGSRVPEAFPLQLLSPPNAQGLRLTMPKLHVLDALIQADESEMSFASLVAIYERFNVGRDATRAAVQSLSKPREVGDTGLIRLSPDIGKRKLGADDEDSVVIRLQPAGRYFREEFGRSSDFLFWSAAHNGNARRIFDDVALEVYGMDIAEHEIPSELYIDYGFRCAIAASYLSEFVFPRFVEEAPGFNNDETTAWTMDYADQFGDSFYVLNAADQVQGFSGNIRSFHGAPQSAHEHVIRELVKVRRYVEELRAERSAIQSAT